MRVCLEHIQHVQMDAACERASVPLALAGLVLSLVPERN